eukprot:CAMPEP_0115035136 /NCGR_PEP_ID=MMETSP0216-20121206/41222_1 /TAXON_ID=223996 /ORGANISM="Protocruzia adherens, Strain Boccale" /LENGTH=253 /DNA_ID=CAMNT_0002414465 /DNA_START=197 /DNA_END=958 /DNA_ORIENTATION=-
MSLVLLDDDCLSIIISFITGKDLAVVMQTSRNHYRIFRMQKFWKVLLDKCGMVPAFPLPQDPLINYRTVYHEALKFAKNSNYGDYELNETEALSCSSQWKDYLPDYTCSTDESKMWVSKPDTQDSEESLLFYFSKAKIPNGMMVSFSNLPNDRQVLTPTSLSVAYFNEKLQPIGDSKRFSVRRTSKAQFFSLNFLAEVNYIEMKMQRTHRGDLGALSQIAVKYVLFQRTPLEEIGDKNLKAQISRSTQKSLQV